MSNYVLFIDESGKSRFSDLGDHFLLCGLIVDRDLHSALSSYMVSLKTKSRIPTTENIHAYHLFEKEVVNGGRHTISHVNTFFERLTALIQGADIRCHIVRVDKREYKQRIDRKVNSTTSTERAILNVLKRNDVHDFLYEAAARKLILEFGHFLDRETAQGEVVAESRRNGDEAVLRAFMDSTIPDRFAEGTNNRLWSKQAYQRISGLTFQNKKGLSFGLEVADLFAWAHFNTHYGKVEKFPSKAKNTRIDNRLAVVTRMTDEVLLKNQIEDLTEARLRSVAGDRVSKFTKILSDIQ